MRCLHMRSYIMMHQGFRLLQRLAVVLVRGVDGRGATSAVGHRWR